MSEEAVEFFYDFNKTEINNQNAEKADENGEEVFYTLPHEKIKQLCFALELIKTVEREFLTIDLSAQQKRKLNLFVDELHKETEMLGASLKVENFVSIPKDSLMCKWKY